MTTTPAPYPADTLARGWRFELDYERIERSSTWMLAPAEAKPWLLMMWMKAWQQAPCGSLPADEEVIAAMIGMPFEEMWPRFRKILMRGWWAADDGRMYHQTLTERVMEMMGSRRKESDRKAISRSRNRPESGGSPDAVPAMSRGTSPGQPQDPTSRPPESDTGTGTGTGTINTGVVAHTMPDPALAPRDDAPPRAGPTMATAVCVALRAVGVANCNPSNPKLAALVKAGATVDAFVSAATALRARDSPVGNAFAYVLATVQGQLADAAAIVVPAAGAKPPPNRQEALEQRNRSVAAAWAAEGDAHETV